MASFLEVLATIVYGCFVLGIRALVSQVRNRVGFGYAVVIRAVYLALEAAEGVPLSIQRCYLRQGKRCVRICRRLTKPYHLKIHGCLTAVLHSRCISKKYKDFANKLAGSLHNILDIPERLIIWLVCCLCGWNKFLWTRVSCVCTIVVTACGGFTHIGHDTLRWSLLKVQSWACIFSSLVKSVAQLYYRTGKCTAGQQAQPPDNNGQPNEKPTMHSTANKPNSNNNSSALREVPVYPVFAVNANSTQSGTSPTMPNIPKSSNAGWSPQLASRSRDKQARQVYADWTMQKEGYKGGWLMAPCPFNPAYRQLADVLPETLSLIRKSRSSSVTYAETKDTKGNWVGCAIKNIPCLDDTAKRRVQHEIATLMAVQNSENALRLMSCNWHTVNGVEHAFIATRYL